MELAIWERSLFDQVARWLDALSVSQLPDGRMLVAMRHVRSAILSLLEPSMPAGPMRDLFLEDVEALARRFAGISGSEIVDIRLEAIRHDACWKYHRDNVSLRLLTTYRGAGTEWVDPEDGARALAEQAAFAGPIRRLQRHAVGLFRGTSSNAMRGIVHRSPPIEGTGAVRLLLCLNLPSASSPEVWPPSPDTEGTS